MPNKVVHFKSIGEVTFFRNRRSKCIKISVRPDRSVLVSYPFYVTEKEAKQFLSRNAEWIISRQKQVRSAGKCYQAGVVIKTKIHTIELCQAEGNFRTEVKNNNIRLLSGNFDTDQARNAIEDRITKVYRYEAHLLLPARLKELARANDFTYNRISIRNNKRNWGSCSSANNISLNLQMMKLPDELIDYILLHELVHTEIKDHSDRFWKKLDLLTGSRARELSRQIKKYSTYTL